MIENWRTSNEKTDELYYDFVLGMTRQRKEVGYQKYGKEFVGEPVRHALEEGLDLVFYIATEIRRRRWNVERAAIHAAEEML